MRCLGAVVAVLLVSGCGSDQVTTAPSTSDAAAATEDAVGEAAEQRYPDIVEVEVERGDGSATLRVTVSSPYDSPERYADGWRVLDQDGKVLGEHTLLHDHAGEQPFTRTQSDLVVPEGTDRLTVEGRDSVHGYGGGTVSVDW
jgi:hypothetical protein